MEIADGFEEQCDEEMMLVLSEAFIHILWIFPVYFSVFQLCDSATVLARILHRECLGAH